MEENSDRLPRSAEAALKMRQSRSERGQRRGEKIVDMTMYNWKGGMYNIPNHAKEKCKYAKGTPAEYI